jgi:hypothetical protein
MMPKFYIDDADLLRRQARKWNCDKDDRDLLLDLARRIESATPPSEHEYDEKQER